MSVYDDFQRMWVQHFPNTSLSEAWEEDVRASLQNHKQKINDLKKELEQEVLYVEYLERLLTDAEKSKSNGTATTANESEPSSNQTNEHTTNNDAVESIPTSSTLPPKRDRENRGDGETQQKDIDESQETVQLRRSGALNQCISELSHNISQRRCVSEMPDKYIESLKIQNGDVGLKRNSQNSVNTISESDTNNSRVSQFVTVIEVNEGNNQMSKSANNSETVDQSNVKTNNATETISVATKPFPLTSSASASAVSDVKKKIPPRPPPKVIRRAAPVDPPQVPPNVQNTREQERQSPAGSLDRNIKPTELFKRYSESPEAKTVAIGIKTSNSIATADREKPQIDQQHKTHHSFKPDSTSSPTGSLGKFTVYQKPLVSSTGSLDKSGSRSSDLNLQKDGSRESLNSQSVVTEKLKSFASVSSLSSDGLKLENEVEIHANEPYYDTVPTEESNEEEEEQHISVDRGSSSSRDDLLSAGSSSSFPKNIQSILSGNDPESPGLSANYVNIDYFLQQRNEARCSSVDSDGEFDQPPPALLRAMSTDDDPPLALIKEKDDESEDKQRKIIVNSIIKSETLYVESLNKVMQYMKAIRATLTTSQPVITKEEFQTMFFKIEELYIAHTNFLKELERSVMHEGSLQIGEIVKKIISEINLYGAFLHNYGRAIDTVKKCGASNQQFKEIVSNIVLNSTNEQSLSLEDLLHKPVARVQKNALVLQDLIDQTPENHPDHLPLKQAQTIMQKFLSEFNVIQTKSLFPSVDKSLRRLVKNSFIVELSDGHRKLRHLFLFNDVIACAKYKPSGRDHFEFELKWFIPLQDIVTIEESTADVKEVNPVNILHLKSQACTVRDLIYAEEKDQPKKTRAGEKHKRKLADIEAQLVLASPNLVFRIGNKSTNKTMTFFLSSEFERTQWIETISGLQQLCNLASVAPVNIYDLQAWITACQKFIQTIEMGSYLMRKNHDERLLVGDLYFTINDLIGLSQPTDLFICVETDSYGHYFRKSKTKLICRSTNPKWNETFIIELEGSQNVRVLLYEDAEPRPKLRAKYTINLSRQWLKDTNVMRPLKLTDAFTLHTTLRFIPGEDSLRRVPNCKPGSIFGIKLATILKREERQIPFIITACVREVERRGMSEVGVYRVSGSASDLARLKKAFETNSYEAEQLLKEVDIHSVTGILKTYLRDLPEALFTSECYPKLSSTFNQYSNIKEVERIKALNQIFSELPPGNQETINFLLMHLIRVYQQEAENKMSLHNLAMVFGPTLLRPGKTATSQQKDALLESSTVDVMAQAGIIYCFLQDRLN